MEAKPDPNDPPSKRNRTVTMILAALPLASFLGIPIFGLQRFYAGKWVTGIIWFFTGGVFLIGQIVDIICIATGSFTDDENRVIENWGDSAESSEPNLHRADGDKKGASPHPKSAVEPRNQRTRAPRAPFDPIGSIFGFLGGVMMLVLTIQGLGLALGLPDFIAAGLPDPDINAEITDATGDPDWPLLAGLLQWISLTLLASITAFLLIVARRKTTGAHLIRGILAVVMLLTSVFLLYHAVDRAVWVEVAGIVNGGGDWNPSHLIGPIAEGLFLKERLAIASLVVFLATQVMLAWPTPKAFRGGDSADSKAERAEV